MGARAHLIVEGLQGKKDLKVDHRPDILVTHMLVRVSEKTLFDFLSVL